MNMIMVSQILKFLKNLIITSLLRGIGIFYSFFLVLKMLFDTFRFGTKIWGKKQRRKTTAPRRYISWSPPDENKSTSIIWKHCYVTANELRFHYVAAGVMPTNLAINNSDGETKIIKNSQTKNKPKLLLCLHGFPESWYSWRYLLKDFDDKPTMATKSGDTTNWFVVALDTRGCGDSDKPSGIGSYHRNHLAADVKAVIAALGYEKASLIGHDWGGVVLWKVVEDYPEIVDRFIALNSPHHDAGLSHALQNPKQLLIGSWYMYVFMLPLFAELFIGFKDYEFVEYIMGSKEAGIQSSAYKLDEEDYEVVKYILEGGATTGGINYYRALLLPFYQPPEGNFTKYKTTNLSVPILVLWGVKDAFLSTKMALMTRDYLPVTQPASRVDMVNCTSHWIQQDQPKLTCQKVREFLSE